MPEPRLEDWIGRTEQAIDVMDPWTAAAVAAIHGIAVDVREGAQVSGLWHWFRFLAMVPRDGIGPDGHPKRGEFLPPVPLERRMWAGSRMSFPGDLRVGDRIERRSEILKVVEKAGKAGAMVFVTVSHLVTSPRGPAVEEEQDIVYLPMPKAFTPPAPVPLPDDVSWRRAWLLDPVLLFRFSAITFNAHRIHYDRAYATGVEKYPGLVVQGPMQALTLFEEAKARHPGRRIAAYSFRGVRPLFDFDQAEIAGRERQDGIDLFTANGDGLVCMQASLTWAAGAA